MPDKHQFTLKWLLVEVALVAVGIGLTWFFIVNTQGYGLSDLSAPLEAIRVIAIPSALACFGAAVGGLFRRMIFGMMGGLALFLLLAIWITQIMPYLPFH